MHPLDAAGCMASLGRDEVNYIAESQLHCFGGVVQSKVLLTSVYLTWIIKIIVSVLSLNLASYFIKIKI